MILFFATVAPTITASSRTPHAQNCGVVASPQPGPRPRRRPNALTSKQKDELLRRRPEDISMRILTCASLSDRTDAVFPIATNHVPQQTKMIVRDKICSLGRPQRVTVVLAELAAEFSYCNCAQLPSGGI
jgi:hypothetical protein